MNRHMVNREFVTIAVSAVLWRIENLVTAGEEFDAAKRKAIKQGEPSWRALVPETYQAIKHHAWEIQYGDMGEAAKRAVRDRVYAELGKARGRPLTWWDRFSFALTGKVAGR